MNAMDKVSYKDSMDLCYGREVWRSAVNQLNNRRRKEELKKSSYT